MPLLFDAVASENRAARNTPLGRQSDANVQGKSAMHEDHHDSRTAVWRGLKNRCPNCGKGKLLVGYLTVNRECEVCQAPLWRYPAADGPAFFAMTIMLLLLIPMLPLVWAFRPSPVMLLVITGGLTTILTLIILRFVKGAFIGYLWAKNERDRGA